MAGTLQEKLYKKPRKQHEHFVDPLTQALDILSEAEQEIKRDILTRFRPGRR